MLCLCGFIVFTSVQIDTGVVFWWRTGRRILVLNIFRWINLGLENQEHTPEYERGLTQFLDFAFMNAAVADRIKCPCRLCYFTKWHTRDIVHAHLICKQFPLNYIIWVVHGESNVLNNSPNIAANLLNWVLGKEHSGRVRCLGLGVVPSRSFKQTCPHFSSMSSSTSNSSCPSNCQENYTQMLNAHKNSQENYKELVNSHNLMMNAFKAYMIMKEGTIPEQFAGFFTTTVNNFDLRKIKLMYYYKIFSIQKPYYFYFYFCNQVMSLLDLFRM
ncbi:uncharacterized protein LOC107867597 isoform X2 [Capsicum annuum]|uniref:uncharacterized protein LOC107867597 isoform X2 n=1 Tax=Capsicum annuum TaxID=4072 RepID=UPI001FB0F79B|nr:uncharacterized protein LOC107867597 isoform X2 [Capsicum annuum]